MASHPPTGRANRSVITGAANSAAQPFRELYARGWLLIGGMIGLIIAMWLINLAGGFWANLMLLLVGSVVFWFKVMAPIMQVYGLGFAGAWSVISLQSPRAGIPEALRRLYKAEAMVYFVLLVSGILLSTIYFLPNPFSFWALAFIAGAGVMLDMFFTIPGDGLKWKIIGGLLVLCAISWLFNVSIAMPGSQDGNVAAIVAEIKSWKPVNWPSWATLIVVVLIGLALLVWLGGRTASSGAASSVSSVLKMGAGLAVAVLAFWLATHWWSTSEAKATEAGCESVQDVRILMGDYEDIELPRNCVASFDVTGLPIRDRGLRTQVAGEDAPSRFGRMHPVRRGGSGELIGWELRPHYAAGRETKTFRVSWRNSKEPSLPEDTSAPAEIDLKKAEAAIAIS